MCRALKIRTQPRPCNIEYWFRSMPCKALRKYGGSKTKLKPPMQFAFERSLKIWLPTKQDHSKISSHLLWVLSSLAYKVLPNPDGRGKKRGWRSITIVKTSIFIVIYNVLYIVMLGLVISEVSVLIDRRWLLTSGQSNKFSGSRDFVPNASTKM